MSDRVSIASLVRLGSGGTMKRTIWERITIEFTAMFGIWLWTRRPERSFRVKTEALHPLEGGRPRRDVFNHFIQARSVGAAKTAALKLEEERSSFSGPFIERGKPRVVEVEEL